MTDGRFDVYRNVFALIVEIDDYEGETHLQIKRAVDYILEHFISPTSGMNLIDIIQQYFSFHYPFRLHIPICQSVPTKVIPYPFAKNNPPFAPTPHGVGRKMGAFSFQRSAIHRGKKGPPLRCSRVMLAPCPKSEASKRAEKSLTSISSNSQSVSQKWGRRSDLKNILSEQCKNLFDIVPMDIDFVLEI